MPSVSERLWLDLRLDCCGRVGSAIGDYHDGETNQTSRLAAEATEAGRATP